MLCIVMIIVLMKDLALPKGLFFFPFIHGTQDSQGCAADLPANIALCSFLFNVINDLHITTLQKCFQDEQQALTYKYLPGVRVFLKKTKHLCVFLLIFLEESPIVKSCAYLFREHFFLCSRYMVVSKKKKALAFCHFLFFLQVYETQKFNV